MVQTTKTEEVRARVTITEKAALAAIAEKEILNLSEAVRTLVREGAQRRGLWPPPPVEQRSEVKAT